MAVSDTSKINLMLRTLAYFTLHSLMGAWLSPFLEGPHHIQAPIYDLVYEICPTPDPVNIGHALTENC